jgi:CheY-like chemotaxis protein
MSDREGGGTPSLSGSRILVVEDEYFLADDLMRALRSIGAEILGPFDNAEDALRILASEVPPHGAVLDINLHGAMNFDVAADLVARSIPFVFTTGYDQGAIPPEFADVPRWEKPFDPAALARALPSLVGRQS